MTFVPAKAESFLNARNLLSRRAKRACTFITPHKRIIRLRVKNLRIFATNSIGKGPSACLKKKKKKKIKKKKLKIKKKKRKKVDKKKKS